MVWFVKKKLSGELSPAMENEQALMTHEFPAAGPVQKPAEPTPVREAPLFIKVDRYKEMLSYFGALKNDIETLKQLGSVLNSAQEMFMETNRALGATLDKTNKIIETLDAEMGRPQGLNIDLELEAKRAEMKVSLNELKAQLEKLKSEVKAISS
ncbi:MAG: hypothetical protein HY051_04550 [Candidatus Aenigmarchaeota archaeon]|nr:hypothetical protein [Candidatus Aenigmarchaeota archaeon]